MRRAQGYVQDGRRFVVDIDLEKFFDRVNHDVLMGRLAKRIADRRVLGLVRRYLDAGVLADGVVIERHEGTPQGGPLSPLLANLLLDEVDKELERRGHAFVRYADDLNIYVRSKRAGERVMEAMRRLYARLKLHVNEAKSAVARATERKFLGFSFWIAPGRKIKRRVATETLKRSLCANDRETGSLEEFSVEGADGDVSWSCRRRLVEALLRLLPHWRRRARRLWCRCRPPRTRRWERHRGGVAFRPRTSYAS